MPYQMVQLSPRRYSVVGKETGKVHAKRTTKKKAEAQIRLLKSFDASKAVSKAHLASDFKDRFLKAWRKFDPESYTMYYSQEKQIGSRMIRALRERSPSLFMRIAQHTT